MLSPQAPAYWRAPFRALATGKQLAEYVVLDVEDLGQSAGRFALARAEVWLLPYCSPSTAIALCRAIGASDGKGGHVVLRPSHDVS